MLDKIEDKDVKEMIEGIKSSHYLREGLCHKDVSKIDFSNLSYNMFLKLSFDEDTVFSKEQEERFHPKELLENAKCLDPGLKEMHDQNITGKGIFVAIIDSNIDFSSRYIKENVNVRNKDLSGGKEEVHGATVLSAFLQIAPDAQIVYYCNNKKDKNKDENVKEYIKEIAQEGNIKIISMSVRIRVKNEIDKILEEGGITLIDSEEFSKDFTYCFRKQGKNGINE